MHKISQNKILGKSYKRVSFQHKKEPYKKKEIENKEIVFIHKKWELPLPLTKGQIRYFLFEFGRQELSGMVSQCVDYLQELKHYKCEINQNQNLSWHFDDEKVVSSTELMIELDYAIGLWQHRLQMLCWIHSAQYPFQWELVARKGVHL